MRRAHSFTVSFSLRAIVVLVLMHTLVFLVPAEQTLVLKHPDQGAYTGHACEDKGGKVYSSIHDVRASVLSRESPLRRERVATSSGHMRSGGVTSGLRKKPKSAKAREKLGITRGGSLAHRIAASLIFYLQGGNKSRLRQGHELEEPGPHTPTGQA